LRRHHGARLAARVAVRIWDISPGYLNRQSLLGEHRELHGLHSILVHAKKGYSRHPETLRWIDSISGLIRRHAILAAEMHLRGYHDRTPLSDDGTHVRWPREFVTAPAAQFALLRSKYRGTARGRIPLPRSAQELWAHHKYSVLARDPAAYRALGRRVARLKRGADYPDLATDLVDLLRHDPPARRVLNALEHMWGYVSDRATADEVRNAHESASGLLRTTCQIAIRVRQPFLLTSTALADLALFVS
jgi:pyrimidine dimer DNA glycosylase/uncharacterized protein DUF1722